MKTLINTHRNPYRVTYTYERLIYRQHRFGPQELFPVIFEEERTTNEQCRTNENATPKKANETGTGVALLSIEIKILKANNDVG